LQTTIYAITPNPSEQNHSRTRNANSTILSVNYTRTLHHLLLSDVTSLRDNKTCPTLGTTRNATLKSNAQRSDKEDPKKPYFLTKPIDHVHSCCSDTNRLRPRRSLRLLCLTFATQQSETETGQCPSRPIIPERFPSTLRGPRTDLNLPLSGTIGAGHNRQHRVRPHIHTLRYSPPDIALRRPPGQLQKPRPSYDNGFEMEPRRLGHLPNTSITASAR